MDERVPAEVFSPGEYLDDELKARGWTQTEFAEIIRRPQRLVSEIVAGKRGITPETANVVAAALGTSAQFWMNLDSAYQLSKVSPAPSGIAQEARLRERFPVREMIKRGWIEASENVAVLEGRVMSYFNIKSLDEEPRLAHAARKRNYSEPRPPAQLGWLFRVKQLAEAMPVPKYNERALRDACARLRTLLLAPEEIRHVPRILHDCGVRFVVVEQLPQSKIDGVCFWLKGSPVIGMTIRHDRIDNFWFVLRHEIEHVLRRDGQEEEIVDDLEGAKGGTGQELPEEERNANAAGSEFCVPAHEMDDFVARVHPMYSEQRVLGFARRIQVHPGLVVGQLQRRLDRWDLFRRHLAKIRHIITQTALTDGFGQSGPVTI